MISIFLTYFSVVGFVLASGAFFDSLASPSLKKQVAEFLKTRGRRDLDLTVFTKTFVAGSISKIFSGDVLTGHNFVKSALISIVSLTLVLVLYSVKNGLNPLEFMNFSGSQDLRLYVFTLVVIVAGVILGDVFSILQTALLLNLVNSIKGAYDIVFLLVCDLIITINIFVFALPLGLQAAIVINDFVGFDVELAMKIDERGEGRAPREISDSSLRAYVSDNKLEHEGASMIAYKSHLLSREYTVPQSLTVAYRNVEKAEAVNSLLSHLGSDPRRDVILKPRAGEDQLMALLLEGKYQVSRVTLANALTYQGKRNMYGMLFSISRLAQNVFPAVVQLQPISLNLGDVFAIDQSLLQIPHAEAKEYYVFCDGQSGFVDSLKDLKACESMVVSKVGEALLDTYKWAQLIDPYVKELPLAPLAFSCLFLTFAFYTVMILTFLTIRLSSLLHIATFTQRYVDVEKSTFLAISTSAVILSVPALAAVYAIYLVVAR